MGQYRERKIHQIDPETGMILRTIACTRFVTGVTWVDGELWHGTSEGDESDLRRIDPRTERSWSDSICRQAWRCRGSNPITAAGSSAAAGGAGR